MDERAESFQARVAEHNASRPGRRRFTPELQEEALSYLKQRREEGAMLETACFELGIPKGTLDRWRRKAQAKSGGGQGRFLRVQGATSSGLTFESPGGHRITGLSLSEARELLEGFS